MFTTFKTALGMSTLSKEQKAMSNEEGKLKRIAKLEENIANVQSELPGARQRATGNPKAYGHRKNVLESNLKMKLKELKTLMPNHSLVKNLNNNNNA